MGITRLRQDAMKTTFAVSILALCIWQGKCAEQGPEFLAHPQQAVKSAQASIDAVSGALDPALHAAEMAKLEAASNELKATADELDHEADHLALMKAADDAVSNAEALAQERGLDPVSLAQVKAKVDEEHSHQEDGHDSHEEEGLHLVHAVDVINHVQLALEEVAASLDPVANRNEIGELQQDIAMLAKAKDEMHEKSTAEHVELVTSASDAVQVAAEIDAMLGLGLVDATAAQAVIEEEQVNAVDKFGKEASQDDHDDHDHDDHA